MIKIMTEDKNLTIKLPKEESDELFNQLALILLNHNVEVPKSLGIPKLTPPKITIPKFNPLDPPRPVVIKEEEKPTVKEEYTYKGFLYIKCKHCGAIKGFCSKHPLSFYKCDCCGETTEFNDERMVKMIIDCVNCGSHFEYHTNIREDEILYDCIKCQSPVDLVYNARRRQFNSLNKS